MKKHSATKKTKPRLFDDIVTNQDLRLPGLEYFFGRERGMHEMVNYARPQIEKLLLTQRKQAVDAINKTTSDIQQQYDKALHTRTKQITAATAASFLKALMYDDKQNFGIKQGVLVCNRDTGMPIHVLPAQNALFSITKPRATSQETPMTKSERSIGNAFDGACNHAKNRDGNIKTQASYSNPHNRQFPIYRGTDDADVDDGSTGELEGVYGKMLVLLSIFHNCQLKVIQTYFGFIIYPLTHWSNLTNHGLTLSDSVPLVEGTTDPAILDLLALP